MKEKIRTFIDTHQKPIALVAGLFVLLCIVSSVFHSFLKSKAEVRPQVAGSSYEIKTTDTTPIADVPTNISFENIPDDSFLPAQSGKLIRVNLVTMQLTRYENGQLIGEPMKVLAKGKKGSFWETPGGTFPVTDTDEDYFSEKANVFFPFTLHLFGSYIIHGVPHDLNNKPLPRDQDGDIRLATADAQIIYEWSDTDTRVSIFSDSTIKPATLSSQSTYITANGQTLPKVSAESYVVGDLDTGEIILESNQDSVHPIASVSKLMTALVSLDTMNQFDFATVTKPETQVYAVNKFTPGEKLALSNLIYPLLLPSSNVAAEIIAGHKDRATFISEMNAQALKLGMKNTHYEDPSGLSSHNVSSANDLFLLTQNLFKEKPFIFNITLLPSYNAQGHYWKNISQFLRVPGYIGGKSGQTDEAKQSNIALFSMPLSETASRNIVIIVLRSEDRYSDTMKIFNFLKSRVIYGSPKNFTITNSDDLSSNITLSFVGDIMLDRGVRASVKTNFGGDYSQLFAQTAPQLQASDVAFANLEGPVTDKGTDLHDLYSFHMDPAVLAVIKTAGLNMLSFANNHVGDWGRAGFDDSIARMDAQGIGHLGAGKNKAQAGQPVIETIKGMKIGFLGFTDVGPNALAATDTESGVLLASDPDFKKIITDAKKQVDALVVSFHWGVEYQEHTDRQTQLAHDAIDAGANVIVGTHPHVVQAVETYHGGLIAYSLGNFIFDQAFSKETMQGMLLKITFDAKTKTLKRYDKYAIKLSPQFQPQVPELMQ